jgi:HAD superfamily hydrolase (TIGR01484 family)
MYKALIFDLDGTAIPNNKDGMPSGHLVNVIQKIKDKMFVSVATGRAITLSRHIMKNLGLTSPCIISGGTQIIDPVTEKILWEKDLNQSQVEKIMQIALEYPYLVFFNDQTTGSPAKDKIISGKERIIYIEPVNKEDTEVILKKLSKIPNITAHKVMSWTPSHFDIHITHSEATKRHSLKILLEILKVHKNDVVAVGDSNNDLPLFELAGYKIAMENGSEELKKKADMIAPSVDKDGLAVVLKKLFIDNEI